MDVCAGDLGGMLGFVGFFWGGACGFERLGCGEHFLVETSLSENTGLCW